MDNIYLPIKKTLPIKYPPITAWTWHANLLSVLTYYDIAAPWIYCNYVQLTCEKDDGTYFVEFFPRYDIAQYCPWVNTQLISRKTVSALSPNICDYIIKCIATDNYVYGIFDEYYIKGTDAYLKYKMPHELFIFGYDSENQRFEVADFTFNAKYSFEKASFNDIEKAYNNIDYASDYLYEGCGGLLIKSFFNKAVYAFNTVLIKESLIDYLESKNTSQRYRILSNPIKSTAFGVNVYKMLIEYLQLVIDGKELYDYRPFHNLFDHKHLMSLRIDYMGRHNLLYNYGEILNDYKNIEQNFLILSNLMLKASIEKDKRSIEKIMKSLPVLIAKEKNIIEKMIENVV